VAQLVYICGAMKRGITNYLVPISIVLLALFSSELQAQCAMCKQAAETSLKNDPTSLARSLNSGILYLMAVPYLMILFIFRKQVAQLWKSVFNKPSKSRTEP
jgi:hypothetical protein